MACKAPVTVMTSAGPISVRCKQCLPCRIMKQSGLSLRALLEYRLAWSGVFLTLTYASAPDEIDYSDFQKFLKRLRIWNQRADNPRLIRFLACGEYGGRTGRPHFHALIFNSLTPKPTDWVTSLWPHGFVHIGTVTQASIRYTARYTLKFGKDSEESIAHWSKNPALGEPGMIELAAYMKRNGYRLPGDAPPSSMKIEGSSYWLDPAMRKAFLKGYSGNDGVRTPSAPASHLRYLVQRVTGDPVQEQRLAMEARNEFWATARFLQEKL